MGRIRWEKDLYNSLHFYILVEGKKVTNRMKLITEVSLSRYPFRMDHNSPVILTGSCFTENIGNMLERYLFPVCINPFGVTYNPLSVKKGLDALIRREAYTENDLDQYNELWFSFDHYTGFSSPDQDKALERINLSFLKAKEFLQTAQTLIITWGTAWIYRYKPTGEIVCNCHKIPPDQFTRSRLTVEQILKEYQLLLPLIFEHNPDVKIVMTVSPVRHWKDGAHGNQLSKSILLLAIDELETLFPERIFYFPSYEIVMDELRDYRFFGKDLLHTNALATQYIWEKFIEVLLSDESRNIISELESLLNLMGHRPLHTEGEASRKMIIKRDNKLREMKEKYSFLAWDNLK